MHVRWIPTLLFAATATNAFAQSPNVLSGKPESDAVFARRLYDLGQTDMAEALCSLLEKSGKLSGKAALEVESLHIDLRIEIARKTQDLAQRKDLLKQALQDKEEFIKQHDGTPEAEMASLTLPDTYAQLGDTIQRMIKAESQPAIVADYQTEGRKLYEAAEDRMKARIEELTRLKQEKEDREEEDPKLEEQLMTVRFNLARTLIGHSQLYDKGEGGRRVTLLEETITKLQEFTLDYSGIYNSYAAVIFEGQCQQELGHPDQALEIWSSLANDLKGAGWEQDKNGVFQIGDSECDLVCWALLQKALLLTELNRSQEAIPELKEFFAKYRGAEEAAGGRGLALLYQLGEMQLAAGDAESAGKTAQRLIDIDGNGPWGTNGRVLQDKVLGKGGGSVTADKLVALARTQFQRNNQARALELCRQAVVDAKGDAAQAKTGLEAFLLMGDIFRSRGWDYEAVLCYDAGAERYANVDDAPLAVYRGLQSLQTIYTEEKRPYFKRRIEEHQKTLTTRYANHPLASNALLTEGQIFEAEDDYLKAAESYQKIQPTAKVYLIAQYSVGSALFLHARTLAKDPAKKAEAKPFYEDSIRNLQKSIADLDKKVEETFDEGERAQLTNTSFKARITLAQVFLDDNVGKPDEALKTLAGLDENKKFNSNTDNVAKIWTLRIQVYNKQGKLDEAAKLLDGLASKTPDSPAITSAAGTVAREYDRAAAGEKDERKAEELWRRAAKYYRLSGQAQLRSPSGRVTEVSDVADRLYVLGLILNKVPKEQSSFLGWQTSKAADTQYWSLAADLYEAALAQSPSRKGRLTKARSLGFLGEWERAANDYASFFESVPLVDPTTGKFSAQILNDPDNNRMDVRSAYIEWGVAENRAGKAAQGERQMDHYANALKVFANVAKNPNYVVPDSAEWWYFKYERIACLFNKGDFNDARIELNQLERTTNKPGGDVPGLADQFKALKAEIEKQNFPRNGIAPSKTSSPAGKPK